jgi:4-amino-4-deoxy-L-arabinose transferase-like glycosyltransferase
MPTAVRKRVGLGAAAAVGVAVVGAAALRLRLLDVPLDRDEGEYAYIGQLLLQGVPPYAQAYNFKLPGIYGAYAAILAAFGQSPAAIHLGLLIVNAATTVLLFCLAARLYNTTVGVSAAVVFAILSLGPRFHGIAGYAEHFVLLPALAGTLLLLRARESRRPLTLVVSGTLFGLAFLVKQSGAAFGLFAVTYTLLGGESPGARGVKRQVLPALAIAGGALLPVAVVGAVLAGAGVFDRFWFWTVSYALYYASAVSLAAGATLFAQTAADLLPSSYLVAIVAAVGMSALFWHPEARRRRNFVLLFTFFSLVGTSAGLYFRNQYFVLLLPASALLAGLGADAVAWNLAHETPTLRRGLAAALTVVPLATFLFAERVILWNAPPEQVSRELFGLNPFPESVEIARYLKGRTNEADRIAVMGSEPQIYFYTGRRGATGYIYMYPLMEYQPYAARMQRQMIGEIEAAHPRFVVLVNASASWNVRPQSDRTVFEWWARYANDFDRVGFVDIVSDRPTTYVWGADAAAYVPKSLVWVAVFERKHP